MNGINKLNELRKALDNAGLPYDFSEYNTSEFEQIFGPILPSGLLRHFGEIHYLDLGDRFYFSEDGDYIGTTTLYDKGFIPSDKLLHLLNQNTSPAIQRIKQMVAEKYILYLTAFKTEEELKRVEIILSSFTEDELQDLKAVDMDCFSSLKNRGLL